MKGIALAFCHAAAFLSAQATVHAERRSDLTTLPQEKQNQHGSLNSFEQTELETQASNFLDRELQGVMRYVPIELDLNLETSLSGDVDTEELNGIFGDYLLTYLQQTLPEYEPVSVETMIRALSEPTRRLETEVEPMTLEIRAFGFVYFSGVSLPTSEYLTEVMHEAFDENVDFVLGMLKMTNDPVLRSTTSVWSDQTEVEDVFKEEYLVAESSPDSSNFLKESVAYILAGIASGVVVLALFAGLHYHQHAKKQEKEDDAGLTEIPWLTVQVPKKAPTFVESDMVSTMEAPIEAVAGDTNSVMIAVGEDELEKIAPRKKIEVNTYLLDKEEQTNVLTKLYERALHENNIFQRKSVSYEEDYSDATSCNLNGFSVASSVCYSQDQGHEVDLDPELDRDFDLDLGESNSMDDEKSTASTKAKKKLSLPKKVPMPSFNRLKKKFKKTQPSKSTRHLDVIEEEDSKLDSMSMPGHLACSSSEETEEEKAGILAALSGELEGVWGGMTKQYSEYTSDTSAASRDFSNTSFQCLGPACVSTMSESADSNEDSEDGTHNDGTRTEDLYGASKADEFSVSAFASQNTESEYRSQITNPSANASTAMSSFSGSTISDDGFSR